MARLRRRAGRGRERAGGHSAVAISRLSRRALPSRKSGPDQPVARNRGRAWRASNERRAVSAPCAHGSHRFDGRDEGREYRTGRPPAGRERSRPADVSAGFGLAGPLGDRSGPAPAAARPGRCLQPVTSARPDRRPSARRPPLGGRHGRRGLRRHDSLPSPAARRGRAYRRLLASGLQALPEEGHRPPQGDHEAGGGPGLGGFQEVIMRQARLSTVRRTLSALVTLSLIVIQAPLISAQRPEEQIELGVKQVEGGDFDAAVITLDAVARALAADGRRPRELTRAYTYLAIAYLGLSQEQTA